MRNWKWISLCRWLCVGLLVAGAVACAKKPLVTEVEISEAPGEALYLKAQGLLDEGAYSQAEERFEDYMRMYPDSPLVPAALMNVGKIYTAREDYPRAREIYQRVIDSYPDSRFVVFAQSALLDVMFRDGRYEEAIAYADTIDDSRLTAPLLTSKYRLAGESYLALEDLNSAADAFLLAYQFAPEEERAVSEQRIGNVIQEMEVGDAAALVARMDDPQLRGNFTLLLAEKYLENDRLDEALATLSAFVNDYPEDDRVPEAVQLIDMFQSASLYNHHTVGCLLPLSGRYESFGRKALQGVELALARLSAEMPEARVNIVIKDTQGDPAQAIEALRELVQEDRVAAVIGPLLTAPAVADEAQIQGIPIITFSQKPRVVDAGDYVFRNFLTPEMQVRALVSYAVDDLDCSRFAILYPQEKYGTTFMNLFWDEVVAYGGEVVGVEAYDPEQSDFAGAIKRLVGLYYERPEALAERETGAGRDVGAAAEDELEAGEEEVAPEEKYQAPIIDFDVLFIPDGPEKAGLILPQLAYYDVVDVGLYGTNLWHSEKLISISEGFAHGAVFPEIFFAGSKKPEVVEFLQAFEAAYGETPGFMEALAYDTATIIFKLVSRPDIRFRSGIKNGLVDMPAFPGVTGLTRFDANGEVHKRLFLLKIEGRRFVELPYGRPQTIADEYP